VLGNEDVSNDGLLAAWGDGVTRCKLEEADLQLYDGVTGERVCVRFTNRAAMDSLARERAPAWRKLDIAYLHTYLIDKLAANAFGGAPKLLYEKSVEKACMTAKEKGGVALIPKATPMEHLRAVSEAGELMPQKSTYFHPKLATGLVINPLYKP
jgi:hypothetical protein